MADVPVTGVRSPIKNKLMELKVGDHIDLDIHPKNREEYARMTNSYYVAAGRLGIVITIRKQEKGLRLWRAQ